MNHPYGSQSLRAQSALALLALLCLALAGPAHADEIKISGFWIPDVNIDNVAGGQVSYTNSTGSEISQPLTKVQGLGITAIPELKAGLDAVEKKDDKAAAGLLQKAAAKAKKKWLRQWIEFYLTGALDRSGDAREAVLTYLRLAKEDADPFFLEPPPTIALGSASAEVRGDLAKRMEDALVSLKGGGRDRVQKLFDAVQQSLPAEAAPAAGAAAGTAAKPAAAPAGGLSLGANTVKSAIVMTRELPGDDPVTKLLQQGKFQEALDQVDKILGGPTKQMSMRLYQKGLAQSGLARGQEEAKPYMDAGLSFMRVIIYYPRTSYTAPAEVEAGWVHAQIGRGDLARKLYEDARVGIDSEADPEVAARLETLVEELTGGSAEEASEE